MNRDIVPPAAKQPRKSTAMKRALSPKPTTRQYGLSASPSTYGRTFSQESNENKNKKTKVARQWHVNETLTIRTGYIKMDGKLVMSLESKSASGEYATIILESQEYMRLKFVYDDIVDQADSVKSGGTLSKCHKISPTLSVLTHYDPKLKEYTVTFNRVRNIKDKKEAERIKKDSRQNSIMDTRLYMSQAEFLSLEKSLDWCYWVFKHHPKEQFGAEMNRVLMQKAAEEMIRLMEQANPDRAPLILVGNMKYDPEFMNMFFESYKYMLNLSYTNDIVAAVEKLYPSRKVDLYVLFHQLVNDIPALVKWIEELPPTTNHIQQQQQQQQQPLNLSTGESQSEADAAVDNDNVEDDTYYDEEEEGEDDGFDDEEDEYDDDDDNNDEISEILIQEPGEIVQPPTVAAAAAKKSPVVSLPTSTTLKQQRAGM